MLWGKDQGYSWFSLGMAALSGLENRALAPLWNRLSAFVFRHGEHFYNFQGLRQYKWKARIGGVFEIARLGDIKDRLTRDLPQGWRQRLALGCALLHRPKILFLDEPTSGVDPLTRRHFWAFIGQLASLGVTVLVPTHYMDEAQHCNRVAIINEGRIVAHGAPVEIIADVLPDCRKRI